MEMPPGGGMVPSIAKSTSDCTQPGPRLRSNCAAMSFWRMICHVAPRRWAGLPPLAAPAETGFDRVDIGSVAAKGEWQGE
eukprot:3661667-Prymnesium_polylepis.1